MPCKARPWSKRQFCCLAYVCMCAVSDSGLVFPWLARVRCGGTCLLGFVHVTQKLRFGSPMSIENAEVGCSHASLKHSGSSTRVHAGSVYHLQAPLYPDSINIDCDSSLIGRMRKKLASCTLNPRSSARAVKISFAVVATPNNLH